MNGGLSQLHYADDEAIAWLTSYGLRALARKRRQKI